MHYPFFLYILICLSFSCSVKPDVFQPQPVAETKTYPADFFAELSPGEIAAEQLLDSMSYADETVGVFHTANGIQFKEATYIDQYYFELEDGKLKAENHGEFGGQFSFIPSDTNETTVSILKANVIYVFRFEGEIYFLCGIAHGMDKGGAMLRLIREGNEFKYEEVLKLNSAPKAMTIYEDKIIIAGHKNLAVIKDLKQEIIIPFAFWWGLYPNSVVAVNDNEVYIGIRGGYAKVSLVTKEARCFILKSLKE